MYKPLIRWMIRRNVRALNAGNAGPLAAGYSDDAVLVFPGNSSWGGEHRGKAAIGAFLERFVASGLTGQVHDILINGPPWNTTVAVLFTDQAHGPAGDRVYENRAVLFARARWGKIYYQEDFEDTHKVEAFDHYLEQRAAEGA